MAVLALSMVVFLAITRFSSGDYCVCNSGQSDTVLQRNIDYACGSGADCSQILQNGPCFNPNTVRDHCNYAVNSYYQRRAQVQGSCDFSGTAMVSQTPPSGANSACYPGNPSTSTPTTPSIAPPGTPGTSTGTPGTSTGGSPPGTPGTSTGGSPPGTGINNTPFGLGPTGTTGTDNSGSVWIHQSTTLLVSAFMLWLRLI